MLSGLIFIQKMGPKWLEKSEEHKDGHEMEPLDGQAEELAITKVNGERPADTAVLGSEDP